MKAELQVHIAQLERQLEEEGVKGGMVGELQEQLARLQAEVGTFWCTIWLRTYGVELGQWRVLPISPSLPPTLPPFLPPSPLSSLFLLPPPFSPPPPPSLPPFLSLLSWRSPRMRSSPLRQR